MNHTTMARATPAWAAGERIAVVDMVDLIQQAGNEGIDYIIINPAGYTHTSVAIRDAVLFLDVPTIEVHLSNIHAREAFRKHSYLSDIAVGVIAGLGPVGYELALRAAQNHLGE
mgnify:CR=1 FL=1